MWADKGVLAEDGEARYKLLEVADTDGRVLLQRARECCPSSNMSMEVLNCSREALEEEPLPIMTVQQQQAEQMKIHWKVRLLA